MSYQSGMVVAGYQYMIGDKKWASDTIRNIVKEVKAGSTYVVGSREAKLLWPDSQLHNNKRLSTIDFANIFARLNGMVLEYDKKLDEYNFRKTQ